MKNLKKAYKRTFSGVITTMIVLAVVCSILAALLTWEHSRHQKAAADAGVTTYEEIKAKLEKNNFVNVTLPAIIDSTMAFTVDDETEELVLLSMTADGYFIFIIEPSNVVDSVLSPKETSLVIEKMPENKALNADMETMKAQMVKKGYVSETEVNERTIPYFFQVTTRWSYDKTVLNIIYVLYVLVACAVGGVLLAISRSGRFEDSKIYKKWAEPGELEQITADLDDSEAQVGKAYILGKTYILNKKPKSAKTMIMRRSDIAWAYLHQQRYSGSTVPNSKKYMVALRNEKFAKGQFLMMMNKEDASELLETLKQEEQNLIVGYDISYEDIWNEHKTREDFYNAVIDRNGKNLDTNIVDSDGNDETLAVDTKETSEAKEVIANEETNKETVKEIIEEVAAKENTTEETKSVEKTTEDATVTGGEGNDSTV